MSILVFDFTTLPLGVCTSATLTSLGLTFARGDSNNTCQIGPGQIVPASSFGSNDAGIGCRPAWPVNQVFGQTNGGAPPVPLGHGQPSGALPGLSLKESRTNYVGRSEDFTASGWSAGGGTNTAAVQEAPDGRVVGCRLETPLGSNGANYSTSQTGIGYRCSVWLRTITGLFNSANTALDNNFGFDASPIVNIPLPGLYVGWQRVAGTSFWTSGAQTIYPAMGTAATGVTQPTYNPVVYAGYRAVAATFAQIERGDTTGSGQYVQFETDYIPSTSGSTVTRAGETLAITTGSACVVNGVLSLWIRFTPYGHIGAYTTTRYLVYVDSNNNVSLNAGGTIVVTVGGTAQTLQPMFWRSGDVVDVFLAIGATPTQVWYRRPGDCPLPLHFGQSALSPISVSSTIFVLSGGSAPAVTSYVHKIDASFSAARPPPWVQNAGTPKNLLVVAGNSISFGTGTKQQNNLTSFVELVRQALGAKWDVVNTGIPGITTGQMNTIAPAFSDALFNLARPKFVLLGWEGTNDLVNTGSGATSYANSVTYYTARKTFAAGFPGNQYKVIAATVIDRNVGGFSTQAAIYNTDIRAAVPGTYADALWDPAGDAQLGNAGASTSTAYFAADGIHPNDAGAAILARTLLPVIQSV